MIASARASTAKQQSNANGRFYASAYTPRCDVPGALWQLEWLDRNRMQSAPELRRIVVAIDPAASNNEGSDETGIVVAGIAYDGHLYVLKDLSGRYAVHEWTRIAIAACRRHKADRVIAEVNNGGAMVEATLRAVESGVSYKSVHASRGKVVRAEPIEALHEQRKVHHVGSLGALEDQLCSFTSDFDRSRMGLFAGPYRRLGVGADGIERLGALLVSSGAMGLRTSPYLVIAEQFVQFPTYLYKRRIRDGIFSKLGKPQLLAPGQYRVLFVSVGARICIVDCTKWTVSESAA